MNNIRLRNVIKESVRRILKEDIEGTTANINISIRPSVLMLDKFNKDGILLFTRYQPYKYQEQVHFKQNPLRKDGTGFDFTEAIEYFESKYLPVWEQSFPNLKKESQVKTEGSKCSIRYENFRDAMKIHESGKKIGSDKGAYGHVDVDIEIIDN